MELPESERGCCCRRVLCGAPAAVWWALLGCALLAALGFLAALLAAGGSLPDSSRLQGPAGGGASFPSPSGARLLHKGPGKTMKPGRLTWYADNIMDGVYLGPGFEYNPTSDELKIKNFGLYFIYAQLSAFCVSGSCSKGKGNATLTIHRKTAHGSDPILTLPLHLSSRSNRPLAAFTAVSPCQLTGGDLLYVMLTVSNNPLAEGHRKPTQWYFGNGTVFGLFPISGNCGSEATGIGGCSPAPLEVEGFLKDAGKFFPNNA